MISESYAAGSTCGNECICYTYAVGCVHLLCSIYRHMDVTITSRPYWHTMLGHRHHGDTETCLNADPAAVAYNHGWALQGNFDHDSFRD